MASPRRGRRRTSRSAGVAIETSRKTQRHAPAIRRQRAARDRSRRELEERRAVGQRGRPAALRRAGRGARQYPRPPDPERAAPRAPREPGGASPSVEARARAKPGKRATGSKYPSAPAPSASKVTRAARASPPSALVGAAPACARSAAARRAASCVRLARCRPSVAPEAEVARRTSSSAASREAPTTSAPVTGDSDAMNTRAASSRTAADGDSTTRITPGFLERGSARRAALPRRPWRPCGRSRGGGDPRPAAAARAGG